MYLDQREELEDDVGLGKIFYDLVHRGLRLTAMGTLKVGELDEFEILAGGATESSVGACLEHITNGSKGGRAERNNDRALANGMVAIRSDKKSGGLNLGAGSFFGHIDDDFGDAGGGGGHDGHDSVEAAGVKAPYVAQEGVHGVDRGRGCGKEPRVRARKRIGGRRGGGGRCIR